MWYMKARWTVKKSNTVDNVRTPSASYTTKCQTGTTQHWIAVNKQLLLPLLRVCCPNHFQSNSFHNAHKISRYAQMTSRNAYMTSRFSVPASAGPLLPLDNWILSVCLSHLWSMTKWLNGFFHCLKVTTKVYSHQTSWQNSNGVILQRVKYNWGMKQQILTNIWLYHRHDMCIVITEH